MSRNNGAVPTMAEALAEAAVMNSALTAMSKAVGWLGEGSEHERELARELAAARDGLDAWRARS